MGCVSCLTGLLDEISVGAQMCTNDSFHGGLKSDIKTKRNVCARIHRHNGHHSSSLLKGLERWLHVANIMSGVQLLCCLSQWAAAHMHSRIKLCVLGGSGGWQPVLHWPEAPIPSRRYPLYKWLINFPTFSFSHLSWGTVMHASQTAMCNELERHSLWSKCK